MFFSECFPDSNPDGVESNMELYVRKYYPIVRRICRNYMMKYRKLVFPQGYEDVVQEVMIRLPVILRNFKQNAKDVGFERFLLGSVRHVFLDISKKERRRARLASNFEKGQKNLLAGEVEVEELCNLEVLRMDVRRAVEKLHMNSPEMRRVIQEYYFGNNDDSEIARSWQKTKNQVWRMRQESLERLREMIGNRYAV